MHARASLTNITKVPRVNVPGDVYEPVDLDFPARTRGQKHDWVCEHALDRRSGSLPNRRDFSYTEDG